MYMHIAILAGSLISPRSISRVGGFLDALTIGMPLVILILEIGCKHLRYSIFNPRLLRSPYQRQRSDYKVSGISYFPHWYLQLLAMQHINFTRTRSSRLVQEIVLFWSNRLLHVLCRSFGRVKCMFSGIAELEPLQERNRIIIVQVILFPFIGKPS